MNKFFPELPEKIPFEGPESKNPLAFKYYLPTQVVGQKTMEELKLLKHVSQDLKNYRKMIKIKKFD